MGANASNVFVLLPFAFNKILTQLIHKRRVLYFYSFSDDDGKKIQRSIEMIQASKTDVQQNVS